MKSTWLTLAFVSVLLPHAAAAADRVVLPDNIVPTRYDLDIVPDAAHLRFAATVRIDIDVKAPSPVITLNAADLAFDKADVSGAGTPASVSFDKTEETATLKFAKPLAAGHHVLTIAYRGTIYQHAAGLFALDYQTPKGMKRALYTQFENSDARRFMPSWDEPAKKASFTLTATVPAGEMAVSNMPIAKSEPLKDGLVRVRFQTTPKMSSYLLFFALGDFERVSKTVDGVDLGVVVTRGNTAKAAYALDAAAHILPYYNQYFDVKFPLPKLDLVAGSGESQFFGAMENWGAIFFFDRDLLIDPKISTEADRRDVYTVVAHEMAHQWFGDLVTMAWWDDLWLNEGFASWMEIKATDHFHPEWKLWLQSQRAKEGAMTIDARRSTHPIITPIRDVLQANQAFDTITYSKGQAVIRMLEDYVGADAFRAGVRRYIKAHAYGNSVTDDLWRALDSVQPVPVTKIAHDFTLQAGVPLIRVAPGKDGISLTQDRFAVDDSRTLRTSWQVPVIVTPAGGGAAWHGFVSREKPALVPLAKGTVPVVNAGQAGYYRTLYAQPIEAALAEHFSALKPADQMGMLADAQALGYAGYAPLSNYLALTANVPETADPLALSQLSDQLGLLAWIYLGLPGEAAYDRYAQGVLEPIFARVGWTAKPGEGVNVPLLRSALLTTLSLVNDKAVIAEARTRFAEYVKDPSGFSPELRRAVLAIAAAHPTDESWEAMHKLAQTAKSAVERSEFYRDLGVGDDKRLAQKALELTLTDEVPVTVRPSIIDAVAQSYFPDMAFDFAAAHLDKVNAWLEPDSRNEFEPRLAGVSHDPAMIEKLKAFAKAHIPPGAQRATQAALAKIAYYIGIRKNRLPEVDAWLEARK